MMCRFLDHPSSLARHQKDLLRTKRQAILTESWRVLVVEFLHGLNGNSSGQISSALKCALELLRRHQRRRGCSNDLLPIRSFRGERYARFNALHGLLLSKFRWDRLDGFFQASGDGLQSMMPLQRSRFAP